jgi:hypothetical protein
MKQTNKYLSRLRGKNILRISILLESPRIKTTGIVARPSLSVPLICESSYSAETKPFFSANLTNAARLDNPSFSIPRMR